MFYDCLFFYGASSKKVFISNCLRTIFLFQSLVVRYKRTRWLLCVQTDIFPFIDMFAWSIQLLITYFKFQHEILTSAQWPWKSNFMIGYFQRKWMFEKNVYKCRHTFVVWHLCLDSVFNLKMESKAFKVMTSPSLALSSTFFLLDLLGLYLWIKDTVDQ